MLASYRELFAGLSAISRLTGSVRISLFVVTITPDLSGTIDQKLAFAVFSSYSYCLATMAYG